MKESHDEGVATHIDPESCAGVRKGVGEALTGGSVGEVLSREISQFRVPTLLDESEGNTPRRAIASAPVALRGRRPSACVDAPCAGTGRSHVRLWLMAPEAASARPKAVIR